MRTETERLARLIRYAWYIVALLTGLSLLLSPFSILRDDTDPPSGPRSQMNLYTDHGTGCQYLGRFSGALTPRLSESGKQMGCRP